MLLATPVVKVNDIGMFSYRNCQDAVMVDCMCVWLYSTLGYEQLNNATVLLRCMYT